MKGGVILSIVLAAALIAISYKLVSHGKHHRDEYVPEATHGAKNATVLIIRHAEKPDDGNGLAPEGEARAKAYVNYFQHYKVGKEQVELDELIASEDSAESHRPTLTLKPLSEALKLPIHADFKEKQTKQLAYELMARHKGKEILICWHHGEIPDLLEQLGAQPELLLPSGKWPDKVYDWVIQLSYDKKGRLIQEDTKRISEKLMPGDSH